MVRHQEKTGGCRSPGCERPCPGTTGNSEPLCWDSSLSFTPTRHVTMGSHFFVPVCPLHGDNTGVYLLRLFPGFSEIL